MHLLSILLFAISSNMDNLVIGLSYGIKKIRIPILSNIVISLITFIGTAFSMIIGKELLNIIPESIANIIGSVVIIIIGGYYLIKFIYNKTKDNEQKGEEYDVDKSGCIELRESFLLGLALSINNIGLGISASIIGLNIIATATVSFVFSLLFLYLSNAFGKSFMSNFLGKYAEPISSILMILLGIYEIFI